MSINLCASTQFNSYLKVALNAASNKTKASNKAATGHSEAKQTQVVAKPADTSQGPTAENNSSLTPAMPVEVVDIGETEGMSRGMLSLDKFQAQQKQIEEANKQKKALLSKTITERFQKAQKETGKLQHIQKELSKLDHLLTADVQVIRGKIEETSRDFMDAQKRFERAEQEYVAAKIDLHSKQEMKEQLTEHLYTIIHQNEVRKAKKLAELMKTLDMEAEETDVSLPELPPFASFQPTDILLSPSTSKQHLMWKSDKKSANNFGANSTVNNSGDASNLANSDNQNNCSTSDKNQTVNIETESSMEQDKTDRTERQVDISHGEVKTDVPSEGSPHSNNETPVFVKNDEKLLATAGTSSEQNSPTSLLAYVSVDNKQQVCNISKPDKDSVVVKQRDGNGPSSEHIGSRQVKSDIKSKWDFEGSLL
ncbi:hypothetical protein DPMN_150049 [Dreissena polymorpha]|uniref:RAB6-interacting golgin n=1 Tax=Dreissena polymorpha TaxID=45954 RepID=A0A9D4FGZ2_DREPO|nr:hypothetical protein DPMN_150049 [Dreissena polymorpha]